MNNIYEHFSMGLYLYIQINTLITYLCVYMYVDSHSLAHTYRHEDTDSYYGEY